MTIPPLPPTIIIQVSLISRPHPKEGKGLGTQPMRIIMTAELVEPRIGTNVPRPYPRTCGGGWE